MGKQTVNRVVCDRPGCGHAEEIVLVSDDGDDLDTARLPAGFGGLSATTAWVLTGAMVDDRVVCGLCLESLQGWWQLLSQRTPNSELGDDLSRAPSLREKSESPF